MNINKIGQLSSSQNSRVVGTDGVSPAVTNGEKDGMPKIIERDTPMKGNYEEPRICTMVGRDPENPGSRQRSDRYEQMIELSDDVSNTLTSVQKDNLVAEPQVLTPKRTEFGKQVRKKYEAGELNMSRHAMTELEPREDGISNTLTSVTKENIVAEPLRIRKLTPRECFRLMGVCEADIDKIQASGVSNSQQYKMAGNSIVVDCLYHLFRKMFTETQSEDRQLALF